MFQFGKKYYNKYSPSVKYECVYVGTVSGVLKSLDQPGTLVIFDHKTLTKGVMCQVVYKTFKDLCIGQRFKWAKPRDCGDVWCIKIKPMVPASVKYLQDQWMIIQADHAEYGTCWVCTDNDLVEPAQLFTYHQACSGYRD